jgi:hypothetical protein
MRPLALALLLVLCPPLPGFPPVPPPRPAPTGLKALEGEWELARFSFGKGMLDEETPGNRLRFKGGRLSRVYHGQLLSVSDISVAPGGALVLRSRGQPDVRALYKVEAGRLTICYPWPEPSDRPPADFDPHKKQHVVVYQRVGRK